MAEMIYCLKFLRFLAMIKTANGTIVTTHLASPLVGLLTRSPCLDIILLYTFDHALICVQLRIIQLVFVDTACCI